MQGANGQNSNGVAGGEGPAQAVPQSADQPELSALGELNRPAQVVQIASNVGGEVCGLAVLLQGPLHRQLNVIAQGPHLYRLAGVDLPLHHIHLQFLIGQNLNAGTVKGEHPPGGVGDLTAEGEHARVFDTNVAGIGGQVSGNVGPPILTEAVGVINVPLDGGILHHVLGFNGHGKGAVRVGVVGHRPGHGGNGIDGERLLIGIAAASRVLETGGQLILARLLELDFPAVSGQFPGHIVGDRDILAVPGQGPAQGVLAQFLKACHQRDNRIGVEHFGQIEAGHAHGVNLDGIAGGGHAAQLIRHAGGEGIKARFGEEAMPASGGQVKGRYDLLAVPQDCPDHFVAAQILGGQPHILRSIGVAHIVGGNAQADNRVNLDCLRTAILPVQRVHSGGGQGVGPYFGEPDLAAQVAQVAQHGASQGNRRVVLRQRPRHIPTLQIGGQEVHGSAAVRPRGGREGEVQARHGVDCHSHSRSGEHPPGGVGHAGGNIVGPGAGDLDGAAVVRQVASVLHSSRGVIGRRDLPGHGQGGVLFQRDTDLLVRMGSGIRRQLQGEDGIDLNGLLIGEVTAQAIRHRGGQDVRASLEEFHVTPSVVEGPGDTSSERNGLAVHGQGPRNFAVPYIFGGHFHLYRLIRVGELRELEGQAHGVPYGDGGAGAECPAQVVRHAGGHGVVTGRGECDLAAVII